MNKPGLEVIAGARPAKPIRAVIFDFDDTLSLLRSGWQEVMIQQAMDELGSLIAEETPDQLREAIVQYVDDLTGRPTIHQMARLAEEVAKRGGVPRDPERYKADYVDRLHEAIVGRTRTIRENVAPASSMHVFGAESLLQSLREAGLTLILASGTDDEFVQSEMRLLQLAAFFSPHIYGAPANDPTFSKGRVVDDMIRDLAISGEEIVGVGDGVVEIRETRRVGGFAIGIAKWSESRPAEFSKSRLRLIDAGAQAIIPDFGDIDAILALLGIHRTRRRC